jgi:hypothetical protein
MNAFVLLSLKIYFVVYDICDTTFATCGELAPASLKRHIHFKHGDHILFSRLIPRGLIVLGSYSRDGRELRHLNKK